ncbi:FtsX-like permease family protein [Fertoebacter nigrum]|uniref:FtsX-like permease family protein n=1 Tax=Fertoeibacter niger TaxID=2656921 RepID=A0A8X8KSH6_9RHOB|nr:FtsX-like permease family protein [Fertoeibacter niger]NUB46492.1 FtsX-like permease family protein [Fertoeibacter niger]
MTAFLTRLLGRLPVGYLQLTHSPGRLLAALAGVAFANVLVFVQLGLAGSMAESVAIPYRLFQPNLLILSPVESETLTDAATLPRQRLFQALVHPDVTGGTSIYVGRSTWISGHDASSSIQFFGLASDAGSFLHDALAAPLVSLSLSDTALVDTLTRFVDMRGFVGATPDAPVPFEIQNRQLGAVGNVSIGGGFGGDGVFLVSDQTFFHLFPQRSSATPSHILLGLAPGADPGRVAAELVQLYPPDTVRIRAVTDAMAQEVRYQMTERPTGLIFAFGVVIGMVVGIVIAYQVLSADVADHLREYATFKAMGFRQSFFIGIILEEAIILAAIGFWPGLAFSALFYQTLAYLTNIPIFMTPERAVAVFVGTILACALSGILAMRKLAAAQPADLF